MVNLFDRAVPSALVCLAGLAVNLFLFGPGASRSAAAGINDFRAFYAAAHLVGSGRLYDPAMSMEQQRAAGTVPSRNMVYNRLPYFALVLWPLGQMPYAAAHWIWKGLSVAALAGFVWLWPLTKRRYTAMAVCWSLAVVACLLQGQDVPFLLLWIALGVRLWRQGDLFAAGLALSLCAEKYHLFFLLPLLLVRLRLWRLGAGLIAGGAVLVSLCFVAGGPHWFEDYVGLLWDPNNRPGLEAMPNLGGLAAQLAMPAWVKVAVAATTIAGFWTVTGRAGLPAGLCLALAAGVVVNVHSYLADCALLLPALCWMSQSSHSGLWLRGYALLLMSPALFLFTFLGGTIVVVRLGLLAFVGACMYWVSRRPAEDIPAPAQPAVAGSGPG